MTEEALKRPDYGIDAPPVIRNLILAGVGCLALGVALSGRESWSASEFLTGGVFCLLTAMCMVLYAKIGKFRHRDRILAMREWRGDEIVLDVGTGRGLLMIGAAKRVPRGRAYGIDIWNTVDLSGNSMRATLRNAAYEKVLDRIELKGEDARKMSFPDGMFDVVLSNLCLHNIPTQEGRAEACREIARVLKAGGIALISDMAKIKEYAAELRGAGLEVETSGPYFKDTFPPLTLVKARKRSS